MASLRTVCCRWLPSLYLIAVYVLLVALPIPFSLMLRPYSWSHLPNQTQNIPSARFDARMVGDTTTQYLFGGQTMSAPYLLDDLWALDTVSLQWTQKFPPNLPASRARYSAVFTSKTLFLFGGDSLRGTTLNDLWQFDGTSWIFLNTTVSPPPRARAASALLDTDNWVIFGGENSSKILLGDIWMLSVATISWAQLPPGPGPRLDAAMLGYHNSIFIYGGRTANAFLTDLWQYDFKSWNQIALYPLPPKQPFIVLPPDLKDSGSFGAANLRLLMSSTMYALDTEKSYWTFVASDFPQDLEGIYSPAAAAVHGGMDIFVFGGVTNLPVQSQYLATFNIALLARILSIAWIFVGVLIIFLAIPLAWRYCFQKRARVGVAELLLNLEKVESSPFLVRLYQDTVIFYSVLFLLIGTISLPSLYANFAFGVGPLEFRSSTLASNANVLWYVIPDLIYTIVYLALIARWFRTRVSSYLVTSRREEQLAFNTVLVNGKSALPFVLECGPALSITNLEGSEWTRVVFVRTVSKHRLLDRCRWYRHLLGWAGMVSTPPSILETPSCESDIAHTNVHFGWWFGTLFLCTSIGCTALYISAIYFAVEQTLVQNGWILGGVTAIGSTILRYFVKGVCSNLPWSRQSREASAEALCLMLEFSQIGGAYFGVRVWLGPVPAVAMIYGLLLTSLGVRVLAMGISLVVAVSQNGDKIKMAEALYVSPITSWSCLRLLLKTTMLFCNQVPLLLFLCSLCLLVVRLCDQVVARFCRHYQLVIQYPSYNPALWALLVRQHEFIIVAHLLSSVPIYVQMPGANNALSWWIVAIALTLLVQFYGRQVRSRHLIDLDLSTSEMLLSP